MKTFFSDEQNAVFSVRPMLEFPPVNFAVSMLFLTQSFTSMDYLPFASTGSSFGLPLTSTKHQKY